MAGKRRRRRALDAVLRRLSNGEDCRRSGPHPAATRPPSPRRGEGSPTEIPCRLAPPRQRSWNAGKVRTFCPISPEESDEQFCAQGAICRYSLDRGGGDRGGGAAAGVPVLVLSRFLPDRVREETVAIFPGNALGAAEFVLDADDVVFAQIGAGLHLDQLEQDLAGVGEAVHAAERQVDRLVFGEHRHLAVAGDLGGA